MLRAVGSGLEDRFQTLHEIVKAARANLAPGPWDYLVGGAETETTLRRNRLAIDSLAFRPRVLRDVSQSRRAARGSSASRCASRSCWRPSGRSRASRPAAARPRPRPPPSSACRRCCPRSASRGWRPPRPRPPTTSASSSSTSAATTPSWTTTCSARSDHGYTGFCLTVDTASYSRRERDLARRFVKPWRVRATGCDYPGRALAGTTSSASRTRHDVPLILKGIATGEDAALAVEHGVDVVYVSNHGGRQLDHGRGSLDVLPEVVKAVGGPGAVIVDGGFHARHRRGEGDRAGRRSRGHRPAAVPRPGRGRRAGLRARARADGGRDPHRAWRCSAWTGSAP